MRFWSRRRTAASETFEDVLARCLASVNDGTRDVDACLAAYPQYADRLGPALRTAAAVRAGLDARPNAAFVQRARARVIAAANGIQPVASPPPHTRRAPTLRPLALTAAAFVLLFAVLIPSLAVTSASALPGDWNYGIKLVTEQARLAVMFDAADRQAYHLELSERRAHEITRLVELGRVEEIPAATRAYQDELAKAVAPVKRSSPPSLSEAEKIRDSVTQQEVMLTIALRRMQEDETAPSPNSPTPAGTSTQSRSQTPPPTDPSQPAPAAATEIPRASAPQQATQVIEAVQTARDAAHGARAEAALATERAQEVERTRVQQVVTPLPSETATAARPTGTPTPASPTPTPTSSPVPSQTASPTAGPLNDGAGGPAASPSATGTASAVASPQPTTG
ncbi:MAG TPA: DUF5667 domain-containing protein, partial [Dehalococcoidia bacterium]|nr:DUF5667 domain-containing protein [Dehalococcoidia bacterium]